MRYSHILLFALVISLLFITQSCDGQITETLSQADGNRSELLSVIKHYRDSSDMQQEAALFLIGNMYDHRGLESTALDSTITRINSNPGIMADKELEDIWMRYAASDSVVYTYDARTLSAKDIIDNIDSAYRVWKNSPWNRQVPFDIFCQYILPYRVADERFIGGWREKLYSQYSEFIEGETEVIKAYERIHQQVIRRFRNHSLGIPHIAPLIHIGDFGTGSCMQGCVYEVAVMRSLGIPATIDYITHWSNYSRNGHAWCVLPLGDKSYSMTKHDTIASRFNTIDSAVFPIPDSLEPAFPYAADFKKRVSKIRRRTYGHLTVDFCDDDAPEDVRSTFTDPFSRDVTSEYITEDNKLDDYAHGQKITYLCTFLTGKDWIPAAYAVNGASFGVIGDSTAYLLACYEDGCLKPINNPIIVMSQDKKRVLDPDFDNTITITVDRKYPLVGKFIDRWAQMRGGRFEGSDSPTFNNPVTLTEIKTTPVYRNVYHTGSDGAYRYIRYVSPRNVNFPITEFEVYAGGEKLKGRPFSSGIDSPERAFDNDCFKILENATPGYNVGLDLGKSMTADSIIMYPQNDDNFVVPGKSYELFYYDRGWKCLGKTRSSGYAVTFQGVPSNALLLLHCLDGGHEERVFTWADGKQIWW